MPQPPPSPAATPGSRPASLERGRLAVSINALSRCPNLRRTDPPARISWYSRTLLSMDTHATVKTDTASRGVVPAALAADTAAVQAVRKSGRRAVVAGRNDAPPERAAAEDDDGTDLATPTVGSVTVRVVVGIRAADGLGDLDVVAVVLADIGRIVGGRTGRRHSRALLVAANPVE
jgi:hypothetical protein